MDGAADMRTAPWVYCLVPSRSCARGAPPRHEQRGSLRQLVRNLGAWDTGVVRMPKLFLRQHDTFQAWRCRRPLRAKVGRGGHRRRWPTCSTPRPNSARRPLRTSRAPGRSPGRCQLPAPSSRAPAPSPPRRNTPLPARSRPRTPDLVRGRLRCRSRAVLSNGRLIGSDGALGRWRRPKPPDQRAPRDTTSSIAQGRTRCWARAHRAIARRSCPPRPHAARGCPPARYSR